MKKLKKLRQLTLNAALDLGRLWIALALTDLRLKILPHQFNRRLLYPKPSPDVLTPQGRSAEKIFRLVRLISIAARYPLVFNMSCLRRSLVLRERLQSLNIPSKLVYGMRREPGNPKLLAHAWLEAGNLRIDINTTPGDGTNSWDKEFESFQSKSTL